MLRRALRLVCALRHTDCDCGDHGPVLASALSGFSVRTIAFMLPLDAWEELRHGGQELMSRPAPALQSFRPPIDVSVDPEACVRWRTELMALRA